jgi:hypothetical protein
MASWTKVKKVVKMVGCAKVKALGRVVIFEQDLKEGRADALRTRIAPKTKVCSNMKRGWLG